MQTGAAITPGFALTYAYDRKVRDAGELCRWEGLAFIPVVAESLGGLHPTAVDQLRRLARGVSMKTREEEGTAFNHLLSRLLKAIPSSSPVFTETPWPTALADAPPWGGATRGTLPPPG